MIAEVAIPILDPRRCTGCGDCAAICPTNCLEVVGRTVWLPRPADCIGCGACVAVCPSEALRMPGAEPAHTHGKMRSGSSNDRPQK